VSKAAAIWFCFAIICSFIILFLIAWLIIASFAYAYVPVLPDAVRLLRTPTAPAIDAAEIREIREGLDRLLEIFSRAEIGEFEVTAYAPLGPGAIEGICYSGDPSVTASGLPPIPGETVAAGPGIPFGSKVWIEGLGWRTVNDRGGRITDNHLDAVMATRKDAFAWGRQTVRAVVLPPGVLPP
jgi:3D (Asp-Asp-Asp) domain-containing protein